MNTTNRISNHLLNRSLAMISNWLIAVAFLTIFSSHDLAGQCLSVEKSILGVRQPISGIAGNIDVTYQLTIVNNGGMLCAVTIGMEIRDTLNASTNLGTAFVGITGAPVVSYVSVGSALGTGNMNASFDGTAANPTLTDGTGFLNNGDTIIIEFTAEVDVDAAGAPAVLGNTAWVTYSAPAGDPPIASNTEVLPDCWSNCQLACNNQVQVSVNSICEAEILADMVLEGENSVCAGLGFYEVTIYYNNVKVNLPLDQFYLNKKLKVTVRNIVCNNTCWGTLILEDKSPPQMDCRPRDTISCADDISPLALGFPVPLANVDTTVYPYVVSGIDACGVVYLTYTDSLVRYDCDNDSLSATIYRKWCARDPGGYEACCYDTIDLRRGTLADIILPEHYDGLPGNNPMLLCNGNWTKFPNGNPDTTATGTGQPIGIYCGNISFYFSDDTIQVCPGSFTLIRTWTILDWCNPDPNQRIEFPQVIKVVDNQAPIVTCPSNFTVSTNPWSCTGSMILPVPEDLTPTTVVNNRTPYVIENCSGWTYFVRHLPAFDPTDCTPVPGQGTTQNITRLPDGRYRVDNMPLGCNWIYYVFTDGCGNQSVCQFDIEVIDQTPPVAVCQQKTVISVGSNGKAVVPASVFNDHSHDNCGDVTFLVRRMNPGPCGTTIFQPTQEFCCQDVSATNSVLVVLRVIDENGNTGECMVNAVVQDKLPPRLTCPPNVTVNCTADLSNLTKYGTATSTDNCAVTMNTRIVNQLNTCNIGTIIRWFIATDNGGLRDSCAQIITVIDSTPFTGNDIIWPPDRTLNGCGDNPDPAITGKPVFLNKDACNLPIATYEDLVFNFVDGVCFKILRTWTVIDWCSYNQSSPAGVWYHTQVIMVNNTDAPIFTSPCADQVFCITDGCNVNVTLEATAIDSCTPQDELRWTYELDLKNDGSVNNSGNGNRFTHNFEAGAHRVTWRVKDQCGNESSCSYLVFIRDCKRPTPYCLNGIITVLMQNNGSVTIWAKDFNLASEDNCTPKPQLRYSLSSDLADSFAVYTCADIANGISDTIEITLYVTDNDGNQDFCKTQLILQDNVNVCPDVVTLGSLAGAIRGYNNNPSPEVRVSIKTNGSQDKTQNTNSQGRYVFGDLNVIHTYEIQAEYDDPNIINGISTKDIVKIQRHILGIEVFNTPYKQIAADVNRSGSITASDIAELRKLILGIHSAFKNNRSWNFVDANFPLTDDNYTSAPSKIEIARMNQSLMNNDFIAVKTGDVTGEANTGFGSGTISRSKNQLFVEIDQLKYTQGELVKIPMRAVGSECMISGLQFALNLEDAYFEFLGIEGGILEVQPEEYHYADGTLRLSWNTNERLQIQNADVLCYVVCKIRKEVTPNANNINLDLRSMHPEVYLDNEDLGISLIFRSEDSKSAGGYELYQNVPNPFYGETSILFNVPKESFVKIALYDLSGKTIKAYELNAKKGINTVLVKTDEINSNGVLYYRLEAEEYSSTKKMIILK